MKKVMSLLAVLSISALSAYTVDDLEKAIRDINVKDVRHIVSCQTFTQQDKVRFCVLANEIVHNREEWTRKDEVYADVTTPYKPAVGKMLLELLGGSAAIAGGFALFDHKINNKYTKLLVGYTELLVGKDRLALWAKDNTLQVLGVALGVAGVALIIKAFADANNDFEKQKELFRTKYEDALTIQQLVYAAEEI